MKNPRNPAAKHAVGSCHSDSIAELPNKKGNCAFLHCAIKYRRMDDELAICLQYLLLDVCRAYKVS